MHTTSSRARAALLVTILGSWLALPSGARADWIPCGLTVSKQADLQRHPVTLSDGAGGALVIWEDRRSGRYDIYVHHILASGVVDPALPAHGLAVTTEVGDQFGVRASPDGVGGAFVTWQSWPTGQVQPSIVYAHHVLANGTLDPSWPANGRAITVPHEQYVPTIVADGTGGAIVAWHHSESAVTFSDIHAAHVLSNGALDVTWPVGGLPVATSSFVEHFPELSSDGAGGAFVVWESNQSGAYATRILSTGAIDPAWPVNGRHLTTLSADAERPQVLAVPEPASVVAVFDNFDPGGTFHGQHYLATTSVGLDFGSPVRALRAAARFTVPTGPCTLESITLPVSLQSFGAPSANILRVRLTEDAGGAPGSTLEVLSQDQAIWPPFANPFTTTTTLNSVLHPSLVPGTSYWIVTEPTTTHPGAPPVFFVDYVWFVNASGSQVPFRQQQENGALPADPWPGGFVAVNPAFRVNAEVPASVAAVVTWQDFRQGAANGDVYAQRIRSNGTFSPGWPSDGLALCDTSGQQLDPRIISDGGNGAIVAWRDERYGDADVFAQRIRADGTTAPGWPARGRAVSLGESTQTVPKLAPDGEGGAIVTWQDHRNNIADIYAQRVRAAGVIDPDWPADGLAVCTLPSTQLEPTLVPDGNHGAIIAWWDNREFFTTEHDIYASRVYGNGGVASVPPSEGASGLRLLPAFPNPARAVGLAIPLDLEESQRVTIRVVDVAGRIVRTLADRVFEAGPQRLVWDGLDDRGARAASGIYLVVARGAHTSHAQRVALMH